MAVPAAFQLAKQLRQAPRKIAAELAAGGRRHRRRCGDRGGGQRLHQHPARPRRVRRGAACAARPRRSAAVGREDHRRAHQHQPQQGGAHRASAQRRAGRHLRAHAARARAARGGAELHRQHRRAGGRRGGRLPLPGEEDRRPTCSDCSPTRPSGSTTTAGTSTRGSPRYYKDHPEALEWRAATLHAIEAGEGETAELAHLVADAIVEAHLATMLRLDVEYDVLPRESEILHLKFWASAFELLKERKAIYLETEGKNAGCWVMPGLSEEGKVIVRSDGTVTYVGKDIAYQLWKFGLLGKDFYYRPFRTYADGRVLWVTTDDTSAERRRASARARASTTSSTRGNRICRTSWSPACARWDTRNRPSAPCTSPTRWWRSRRAAARSWGSRFPRRTASALTWRSRDARAWALRRTT